MNTKTAAALAAACALAGCAGLPREHGYAETSALVAARVGHAPEAQAWVDNPERADEVEVPTEPLSADTALALAFANNPRIRATYARIGLARAEVDAARRIANPSFGYSRQTPRGGGGPKITRSLAVGFSDLLLLPARKRFATSELARVQDEVAAELLTITVEVESAWHEAVAAQQVAAMRELVAESTAASAELAQRYFDAGNLSRLQLEQERAAAAQARIAATRAIAARLRARAALAGAIGLPADAAWTVPAQLPAPPSTIVDAATLAPRAIEQRLDLAAARRALAQHDDAQRLARRWRWLGSVELGFEQEREEHVSQGPSLAIALPIFDQGQPALAKATAERQRAHAELDALTFEIGNETLLGVQTLNVAREVAQHYRDALIPAREAVVARTQEQVDYMLVGVFELIRARNEEFDAYQEYLEAVRDYWVARAQLRGIVGGALPDDGADLTPTLGVDAVLPRADATPHHDHGGTP